MHLSRFKSKPLDLTNDDAGPQNLYYTTLSTVRDSFLVSARGTEQNSTTPIEYVLRPRWRNVPPGAISPSPSLAAGHTNSQLLKQIQLKDLGKGYYSMMLYPGQEKQSISN